MKTMDKRKRKVYDKLSKKKQVTRRMKRKTMNLRIRSICQASEPYELKEVVEISSMIGIS